MTHKEIERRLRLYAQLAALGIAPEDCVALRRISSTLHRWHELECGDSREHCSVELARGKRTFGRNFEYDDNGSSYMIYHWHDGKTTNCRVPDRERGAQKRLGKIMARYPGFIAYVQGDPRGCALYLLAPGDVPEGASVDSCYSRGVAVY